MKTDTVKFIGSAESRIKDYNQMMGDLHRNKNLYNEDDFNWYKDTLRYWKNLEETELKKLIIERQHEKQGLNPPFCYK